MGSGSSVVTLLATHQNEQCKNRLYSCEFCQDYASTFEDVTETHYLQCGKYPVTCPNDCGTHKMERQDLESHLRDRCPLTLVDCPFNYAGCETQLPRKDMPEHMKKAVTHLTLLATVTQRLSIENQKLAQENEQLKRRVLQREDESHKSMEAVQASFKNMKDKNQELKLTTAALRNLNLKYDSVVALKKQKEVMELQQSIEKLELEKEQEYQELLRKQRSVDDEIRALKEEGQKLKLGLQQQMNTSGIKLLEFRCKYTKKGDLVYSPAFYTHPHGYRMCVCVTIDGKGAHL